MSTEAAVQKPSPELALWEQYEQEPTDGHRNAILEFYWDYLIAAVARWLPRQPDSVPGALSHVAERILKIAIPARSLHKDIKPRVYMLCHAALAIKQALREELPDSYYLRAKHRLVTDSASRLSQKLMRRPTDSETAESLGWSENQVIAARLPVRSPQTIEIDGDEVDFLETLSYDEPEEKNTKEISCPDFRLSERQRRVLMLKYVDGCTQKQIAADMGRSIPWVENILYGTRRSLRKHIEAN